MYKSTPVVSDAEFNSRSTAVPNTFSVSASKYVIIIYAFGSVHEKFRVCNKDVPKPFQSRNFRPSLAKITAEPFQIEIAVLNCFRRRSFHEPNLIY